MRELATPSSLQAARVLVDYLLTQNIPAEVRLEDGQPVVWVHNEDHIERAREIWLEYQAAPNHSRYLQAQKPAQELRKLKEKVEKNYAKLYKDADHFWGRPHPMLIPATMVFLVLSVIVTVWTEFGNNQQNLLKLTFMKRPVITFAAMVAIDKETIETEQANIRKEQLKPLREGELWRLVTPIFLHFTWYHLFFNMYALYTLGGLIEARRSALWLTLFILVTGVFSNAMQFFLPTIFDLHGSKEPAFGVNLFGGMSGVDFALFGYLVAKSIYAPEPGLRLPNDAIISMLVWLGICMTGIVGNIANTAHVAGLIMGFIIGVTPKLWTRWVVSRSRNLK